LAAAPLLTSCAPSAASGAPPELIKPVEAPADIVPVKREDIRPVKVAEGIIIPYSLGLSFMASDSPISAVHVAHGQQVAEGDLLAELDKSVWSERLADSMEEIAHNIRVSEHEDLLADLWLEAAQIAVDEAENEDEWAYAMFNIQEYYKRDEIRRETQELERARLQTRIDALEEQRDNYAIYAPFSGTILSIEPLKPGDYPPGRQPFLYLADLQRLTVRCLTEQTSFFSIAESIIAVVGDDEWPIELVPYTLEEQLAFYYEGITPPARFNFGVPEGTPSGGAVPPTDKRGLIMAYEASREGAPTRPINAAHIETASDDEGMTSRQDFAYADVNGVRERRDIKCGRRSEIKIEVLEGLSEGELVYVD
jgi:multidrug efflux pump subunit AcrA (membrane-fusion protein)